MEKQEKTEQSDFETSVAAQGHTRDSMDFSDLYEECCESRVVLLPVEPYLIHVYWDVTGKDIEKAKQLLGDGYGQSGTVLRFYDVTNIIYDGTNAHGFFDVDIDLQAKDWYVDLWSSDKSYFVDLGFKTGNGFFLSLARSSIARIPCARPATKVDEQYMLVVEDAEKGLSKIKVPEELIRDDMIESRRTEAGAKIRRAESLKREERLKKGKGARPINLPHSIPGELSEPRVIQIRRKFSFNLKQPSTKSIKAQFENRAHFDLTEMSEKIFISGMSSELVSLSQGKNDSAD
jgi:hypothetical protein